MKNLINTTLFLSLVMVMASGCTQKTTTKKSSSSSSSNGSITNPSTDTGTGTIDGCDGVYRANATSCYRSDIPTFSLSGTESKTVVVGPVLWSSRTSLPSTYSQNSFVTDSTFKVRIKALQNSNSVSMQGRNCSGPMAYNFSRIKVSFMLRRSSDSITVYKEAIANVGSFGTKISLPVPGGTTDPYILEVVGVATDHRCKVEYGTLSTNEKAACTAGTYWGTIPLQLPTAAYSNPPTSCVGVVMEYSTDSTYDLP